MNCLEENQIYALPILTDEPIYKKIQEYFNKNGHDININKLFQSDRGRFKKYRYVTFIEAFQKRIVNCILNGVQFDLNHSH